MKINDIVFWDTGCLFLTITNVDGEYIVGTPTMMLFGKEILPIATFHKKSIKLRKIYVETLSSLKNRKGLKNLELLT